MKKKKDDSPCAQVRKECPEKAFDSEADALQSSALLLPSAAAGQSTERGIEMTKRSACFWRNAACFPFINPL